MILKKNWTPGAHLPPGEKYMYITIIFKHLLNCLAIKPNFNEASIGRGDQCVINNPVHMTKMILMKYKVKIF